MRKFVGIFSLLSWLIFVVSSFFVPAIPASTVVLSMRVVEVVFGYVFFLASLLVFIGMSGENRLSHTSLPNVVALLAWAMTMMLAISLAFGTIHLITVIVYPWPWYFNLLGIYLVIGWPVITIYDWMFKYDVFK